MYETFDHTADLGLRIRAADLDTLFTEAAEALCSVIVADRVTIEPRETMTFTIPGDDLPYLLFDWLSAILYQCEGEHRLFGRFEVKITAEGLTATAWGEPIDRDRHDLEHEVKAITYHELKVDQTPEGWLAEVIVDI